MTSHPAQSPTILIVSSCHDDVAMLRDIMRAQCVRVQTARTLADVRRLLDTDPADLVLADSKLRDDCDWKDILCEIELSGSLQPLIVASHLADGFLWAEVLNLGGFDVLAKPFDRLEVTRVVDYALRYGVRTRVPRRAGTVASRAEDASSEERAHVSAA